MSAAGAGVHCVPVPPGLAEAERAAYLACRDALGGLECEWGAVASGENADLRACAALLAEARAARAALADERLRLRLETAARHAQGERAGVAAQHAGACALLRARVLRAHARAYADICAQLSACMEQAGQDFAAFMEAHAIAFPAIPDDAQIAARLRLADAAPAAIPVEEANADLRAVLAAYGE
jgi:hypothetical protein